MPTVKFEGGKKTFPYYGMEKKTVSGY